MDSVYKFTKERLPAWVLNFYNQVSDNGELGVIAWVLRNVKKKVGFASSDFIDITRHLKNRPRK